MAKPKQFFGIGKTKETGSGSKYMGYTGSASKPSPNIKRKTTVKQATPRQIYGEKDLPTNPLKFKQTHINNISRPSGKEDNRTNPR